VAFIGHVVSKIILRPKKTYQCLEPVYR
jgi:hypothetical protein